MNDFALKLLTNDEVIRITMASTGNRQVIATGKTYFNDTAVVWTADDGDETRGWKYLLLVNLADTEHQVVAASYDQLGLSPEVRCDARELWSNGKTAAPAPLKGMFEATLRPHASLLVRLFNCK